MTREEIRAADRRRAVQIVAAVDPVLADRVDEALSDPQDPVVTAIRDLGVEMRADGVETRAEQRATRWWTVGLVVVALGLNSALVGVSMGLQSGALSLTTTAAASP